MEKDYSKYINKNKDILWSIEGVLDRTDKAVLSKWTSANFWGFGETLEDTIELTFPRGYNMKLDSWFTKTQRSAERYFGGIETFTYNGKEVKIYEPERTIVEIIKDAAGVFNDIVIKTIKNFFKQVEYSYEKLMKWANIFKISSTVSQFEAFSRVW